MNTLVAIEKVSINESIAYANGHPRRTLLHIESAHAAVYDEPVISNGSVQADCGYSAVKDREVHQMSLKLAKSGASVHCTGCNHALRAARATFKHDPSNRRFLEMLRRLCMLTCAMLLSCTTAPALAGFDSGSDGSDGAYNPPASEEVDLSLAASLCDCDGDMQIDDACRWDCPSPAAGLGVYDAQQWAVVFKYTTIDIPSGVTVTFKNHPSGAPVVWLATGDVTIANGGVVDVRPEGTPEASLQYAEPGPGGFHGGRRILGDLPDTAGIGPGASRPGVGGAGHATSGSGGARYDSPSAFPLIGGSGAGGDGTLQRGGAGGGAILIASSQSIIVDGGVRANGEGVQFSSERGSGGTIRLIAADTLGGEGFLSAVAGAGDGSHGFIRLEAITFLFSGSSSPAHDFDAPSAVFPEAASAPRLRATMIAGSPAPDIADIDADPLSTDAVIDTLDPFMVEVTANNIPPGTTVELRWASVNQGTDCQFSNAASIVTPCPTCVLSGSEAESTCEIELSLPPGTNEIQMKACWPDPCAP